MRRVGLVLIPLTLLIFNRSAGSDHDDVDQHAQVETELIRTARMAQLRGDSEHAFAKDSCPFVSYIATKPPHRKVVMTFDDGPSPDVTPWVMKVLAERRIPATFFLVGSRIELFKDMPGRIRRAGHLVGNHSWQHPNFHRIDQVTQIGSISSADGRLAPALWPFKLFRYPYGNSTCPSIRLLKQLDYNIVGWHADSCDWAFDRAGTVGDVDAKICDVAPEKPIRLRGPRGQGR